MQDKYIQLIKFMEKLKKSDLWISYAGIWRTVGYSDAKIREMVETKNMSPKNHKIIYNGLKKEIDTIYSEFLLLVE